MQRFVSIVLIVGAAALLTAVAVVINNKRSVGTSVGHAVQGGEDSGLIQELEIDEMLICDAYGNCTVKTIPLNAEEQAVASGNGKDVSVRAVYNGDQPGGPVQSFDRIYGRAIIKPTAAGERWYQHIDFGRSWDALDSVTITRGEQRCNSVVATSTQPYRLDATLDNSTCDGDGQPAVLRWSALLIENDIQTCSVPKASTCKPFAPITALTTKRRGYQIYYGDELTKAYQTRVLLGEPLP